MSRPLARRLFGRSLLKTSIGLALAPAGALVLAAAARALGSVASAAGGPAGAPAAAWFSGGFFGTLALHLYGLRLRPLYVLAHEGAHALAAWSLGEKVHSVSVRQGSGHVDLSRVNAFIALAPYWLPLYALAVVAAYRLLARPEPPWARGAFLLAMGAALAFHLAHTVESLWGLRQSDLDAAGGAVFSLAAIALLNGIVLLAALKCLFPAQVFVGESLEWAWGWGRVVCGLAA